MASRHDTFFVSLCEENYRRIRLYCLAKLGNVQDADDAVQETFRIAYERVSELEAHENPTGFLYRTAQNIIHDVLRERKKAPLPLDEDILTPFVPAAETAEVNSELDALIDDERRIEKLISVLSEKNREIYRLYYIKKKPAALIASELGMSGTAVRMRLVRIRRTLKDAITRETGINIR